MAVHFAEKVRAQLTGGRFEDGTGNMNEQALSTSCVTERMKRRTRTHTKIMSCAIDHI